MNLYQVMDVIETKKESHERNALEVRNYYNALMYLNELSEKNICEDLILKVHNLVIGKKYLLKMNLEMAKTL